MLLAAMLLLAAQTAPAIAGPPAPSGAPSFALPFATGQLVMSYLDAAPYCRAEGRGAFIEPALHACERIEPTTVPAPEDSLPARVMGGMIIEVLRDGETTGFPAETPGSLPLVYEGVAAVQIGADGRVSTCRDVSEDRHGYGSMFGGEGMCAEMLRDAHPFLADAASPGTRSGRVTLRSFSSQPPASQH
jgi:hypothetical protein